jgi:hypothetical protein
LLEDAGRTSDSNGDKQTMDTSSRKHKTAAIIAKAMDDDDYREELLANPKSAIQQELGKELPLGLEVRVVEESANVVYLVLPPKASFELADADLEAVAGGFGLAASKVRPRATGWYPLDEWLTTVLM